MLRPGEPPRPQQSGTMKASTGNRKLEPPPPPPRINSGKHTHEVRGASKRLLLVVLLSVLVVSCSAGSGNRTQQQRERNNELRLTKEASASLQLDQSNQSEKMAPPAASTQQQTSAVPSEENMKFPLYMRVIATFACLIIFTIGVCGNLLVPLVVIKTKYLRNSTNLFLINLSIADLLVLIVCMPTVLIELHSKPETWLLGEAMCKLSNFVEMLAANGSIFTILAISFERYYAICKPLKAAFKCTRLRATIIICVIWLLACILTSPILIMAKSSETTYIDGSLVHNCILETDTYLNKMYVFGSMIAFFCLPLLVLMWVYWLISRRLIRENIAMMDTTRNNLIDSRCGVTQAAAATTKTMTTGTRATFASGGLNFSLTRKRGGLKKTSSFMPLSSLFGSIRHFNHFGARDHKNKAVVADRYDRRVVAHEKIDSVLLAQPNAPKITALKSPAALSENNGQHRKPLLSGKALSLDYQGDRHLTSSTRDAHEPHSVVGTGPAITVRANGQSSWSANTVLNSHPNIHSSTANIAAAETALTSADDETDPQSSRNTSVSVRILMAIGQLLSIGNRATRTTRSTNGICVQGRGKLDKLGLNSHDQGKISPTSCDSKLIDRLNNTDNETVDHRCKMMNAISCTEAREISKSVGSNRHSDYDATSPFDQGLVAFQANIAVPAEGNDIQNEKSSSSSRSRQTLESKKRLNSRNAAETGGSYQQTRSRFKWMKGFSISSSTGSTYTNSTNLPSKNGSVSQSLHKLGGQHRSSPSPSRSIRVNQLTTVSNATNCDSAVGSRSGSPAKGTSEKRRVPHFDGVEREGVENDSTPLKQLVQTRAPTSTNSYSSSASYNDVDNGCVSDRSSSPASLSTAHDFSAKHSWLDSFVFHEQQNHQHQQHQHHQPQQLAPHLQRQLLSQHDEEQSDESGSGACASKVSETSTPNDQNNARISNKGSLMKGGDYEGAPVVERSDLCPPPEVAADHQQAFGDSPSGSRSRQNVMDERVHQTVATAETERMLSGDVLFTDNNVVFNDVIGGVRKQTARPTARTVTRSLTEYRQSPRDACADNIECKKVVATDTGCGPLNKQFSLSSGPSSARRSIVHAHPKQTSRANLITMAHSLTDNLHLKRSNRRCGSQPTVSNHFQACTTQSIHSELLVVHDISKKQQMDSRRQVVAMLALVVACFFLLFFPYRVFTIWLILSTEDQVQSLGMETYYNLTYFSRILIYLHSAINPIAYNLISTKFRRAFMSILLCHGPATRRNFNSDPHRYLHDSKDQINNNSHIRHTATLNGGSKGSKSLKGSNYSDKMISIK